MNFNITFDTVGYTARWLPAERGRKNRSLRNASGLSIKVLAKPDNILLNMVSEQVQCVALFLVGWNHTRLQ